jgi:DNA-binding CsgD family transcriptional regulator/tetratricopeptide (TPR) repeat protein
MVEAILLERDAHLRHLNAAWDEAKRGLGRTVSVVGEAGVGRSSFVQLFRKFVTEVDASPAFCIQGMCEPLSVPRSLGPLHDIAPRISRPLVQLLREQENYAVIFSRFLEELQRLEKPVALIIEDLQWADAGTLDFIQYLARRLDGLPILLILTFRTCELKASHPLHATIGALPRDTTVRLNLACLSRAAVTSLANTHSVRADLLFELTSGNPFYLNEVLMASVDTLPESVIRFVIAKLSPLSPAARQLCELVSTIPNEAELTVLSQIDFGSEPKLSGSDPQLVEMCTSSGLLEFTGTGLRFRHEIARRVVENELGSLKRKSWHSVMLQIMIRDQTLPKARLVHHAAQAGLGSLVLELAPQAAQEAAAAGAHREACHHFATAIPFAKHSALEVQAQLYEGWAYHGLMSTSIDTRFVEALKRAITLWKEIGNLERAGYNLRMLSVLNWSLGRIEDSFACVTEAIALLEKIPPSAALAMAYSMRAQNSLSVSDFSQAIVWGEKALALATELNAREATVHALNNLGCALMRSTGERHVNGETMLRRSIALGEAYGFHEHAGVAYINYCETLLRMFRFTEAENICNAGLSYVKDHGALALSFSLVGLSALIHAQTNRFEEAQTLAQKVLVNATLSPVVQWPALAAIALSHARLGHPDAMNRLNELAALSSRLAVPYYLVQTSLMLVETYWIADEHAKALQAHSVAREQRGNDQNPWLLGQLVCWAHRLEKPETEALEIAAPYQLEVVGDAQSAAQFWKDRGLVFEQAICLVTTGQQGLVEAADIFTQLQLTPALHLLRQLARKQKVHGVKRGHYGHAASNSFHLTARELEILRHVAAGLSDSEIAEKMQRSKRTVQNHVGALLSKVNAKNRMILVSVAQRAGLLKVNE